VNGKMGLVVNDYTHTVDVLIFKTKVTLNGVNKKFVKLIPLPKKNTNQMKLNLYN